MSSTIAIAANNGSMGGGEVMLLNIAHGLRSLGKQVRIIAPTHPAELAAAATTMGFEVIALPAQTRLAWLLALRSWKRKNQDTFVWNNGLLPAFATSFMKNRLVHLHQLPARLLVIVYFISKIGVKNTLVPSRFMAGKIPGSLVLENWVRRPESESTSSNAGKQIRVGFMGRFTVDKGLVVLADAIEHLASTNPGRYELVVAGAPKFATKADRAKIGDALERVSSISRMLGWVTPADFFSQIDIFVCPSTWEEPFGLVLAECMASRVPFVTSTAGALLEVSGQEYEYQVPPGNALALANRIEALVSARADSAADFEKMLDANYERWRNHYSPEAGLVRLAKVCDTLGI